MARYKRSIWSQVCSSHITQLMDVVIFGAVRDNKYVEIVLSDGLGAESCPWSSHLLTECCARLTLLTFVWHSLRQRPQRVDQLQSRMITHVQWEAHIFYQTSFNNSPDVLLWWRERLRARPPCSSRGPDGAPGLGRAQHQTWKCVRTVDYFKREKEKNAERNSCCSPVRADLHDGDSCHCVAVQDCMEDRGGASPARQKARVHVHDPAAMKDQNARTSFSCPFLGFGRTHPWCCGLMQTH